MEQNKEDLAQKPILDLKFFKESLYDFDVSCMKTSFDGNI